MTTLILSASSLVFVCRTGFAAAKLGKRFNLHIDIKRVE